MSPTTQNVRREEVEIEDEPQNSYSRNIITSLVATTRVLTTKFEAMKTSIACMGAEITRLKTQGPSFLEDQLRQPSPLKTKHSNVIDPGMLKAIEVLQREFLKPKEDVDYYLQVGKQPLHPKHLAESFPLNFKVPQMETYKGTTDPNDHIIMFIA